jgi:Uncharacterised nucleotidyltransferase
MSHAPTEDIVEFLSFSVDAQSHASQFQKFSQRQWRRVLQWLDDAGLAFYFLRKLKYANANGAVPAWVMSRLEVNFLANRERVTEMSCRFNLLNRKFQDAGVRYAVLKGFSLVPEFCPDPHLRYQGDFDYLVNNQSLPLAQKLLLDAGYRAQPSPSSREFIFVMSGTVERSRGAAQYSAQSPHAVELHLDIWDNGHDRVRMNSSLFSTERVRIQQWNGLQFPALTDEDAFLLQVLHACHHLFTDWIRMSCLFEIGYFLNRRSSDASLWNRVEQRVGNNSRLREFVVVISEAAAKLFAAPLPPLVHDWGSEIRSGVRIWIDSYSRQWALCELPIYQFSLFPTAKLARFLRQQYRDADPTKPPVRDGVRARSRLSRIASSLKSDPALLLNADWWRRQFLLRRSLFHALAELRYLCEIPRWRWLNRARMRSTRFDVCSSVGVSPMPRSK